MQIENCLSKIYIAKIGKSIGLGGQNRLILDSDFPEQFFKGASFETKRGELIVKEYINERGIIHFEGINSREDSRKLINLELFTDIKKTKENCFLEKEEYFWFDILNCSIFENDIFLGTVLDIERLKLTDYLIIKTEYNLSKKNSTEKFMIPYIDHFIIDTDIDNKRINVQGAIDILKSN